jgi:hypothetical protein
MIHVVMRAAGPKGASRPLKVRCCRATEGA